MMFLRHSSVKVFEAHSDVGGKWDYARDDTPITASTRFISSKKRSQYPDFPMPRSWPDYTDHSYAKHLRHLTKRLQANRV